MADPADVKQRTWRRIRQWPTWAKWLAGTAAVIFVAGWSRPQFGKVVDERTGRPVAGAYVVRYWNTFGMTLHAGRASCIAFRVAQTNDAGEYFVSPAWVGISVRRDPLLQAMRNGIMVYADGMSLSRFEPGWKETLVVKPAEPNGEKRLDELYRYFNLNGCGSDADLKRKALRLYKALYEEAVQVAPHERRDQTERSFRMEVEVLEKGWGEAFNRMKRGDKGG